MKIDKNTGNISLDKFTIDKDTKINYLKSIGKMKLLSSINNTKEYSLEIKNDEYFYTFLFKENIIESFNIEYIGTAKNWNEYDLSTDFRIKQTKNILRDLQLKEENIFPWGKVIYSYDPRNKTPLINIYY